MLPKLFVLYIIVAVSEYPSYLVGIKMHNHIICCYDLMHKLNLQQAIRQVINYQA